MPTSRSTIVVSEVLLNRASKHANENGETQNAFITRAILNQLEADGDFEIRDLVEAEEANDRDESDKKFFKGEMGSET